MIQAVMTINFEIPPTVEDAIARSGRDPAIELKEAALVELYRQGRLSHGELAQGLGVSRPEADAILKKHNVTEDLVTIDELRSQIDHLRKLVR
jgi:predicted HTH domain antitoxin